jgi:hypothetical protein
MLRTRPKSTWRRATRYTLIADDMREIMAWTCAKTAGFVHHADVCLTSWPSTITQVRSRLVFLVVALVAICGCSEVGQRIDEATNDAAEQALEAAISERLVDAGIELSGDPECSTDLDRDGTALTGTADCTATTSDNRTATASFDGTLSTSGCEGTLTVVIDGQTVIDATEVPGCSVAL